MLYHIIALLVLLFLSAFFSGSETSLFSLSKIRVRRLNIENARNSGIVKSLLEKPTDLLITILIGNMFANVFAASIAASISMAIWGQKGVGFSIAVMTVTVVIFCEIMPKVIAIKNSKDISLFVAPLIYGFSKLVYPMRKFLRGLSDGILSLFEKKIRKTETTITMDELGSVIKEGYSKGGILDKEEAEMMEDVLQLSDKKVEDVMMPSKNIVSFSLNMPLTEMHAAIKEAELSRIPVYEGRRANILGILYAKDLLKRKLEQSSEDIRGLLREPLYISKDMRLSRLLREFRTRKMHLALVTGRDNKLAGLVTLEDLLEEIIGDIRDKESLLQRIQKRYGSQPEGVNES